MIAILLAACTTVCKGPGCEADWPTTRLAIHRGGPDLALGFDALDTRTQFVGGDIEGASWSVIGLRNQLIIGQPEANTVVLVDDRGDAGAIQPAARWISAGSRFGAAIAVHRSNREEAWNLWVGGPEWNLGTGAVWLFSDAQLNGGEVDASTATLRINGGSAADKFGTNIAVCGDLTGDGRPEVAISAPWFDAIDPIPDIEPLAGAVFLLHSELYIGAPSGTDPWELGSVYWGQERGDGAGHAIVCDRDLTGDGIADLAVGAPWVNGAAGRVYIVAGGDLPPDGSLDSAASITLNPPNPNAENWLGMSLITLDLFGDDASDLAVGAPGFAGGEGRVLIYRGASMINSNSPVPHRQIRGEDGRDEVDHIGRWLASGRLYGGIRDDLVVGAPDYHGTANNDFDTGHAWVWRGDGAAEWTDVMHTPEATAEFGGTHPFQRIGRRPATFDVDDDGLDDLLLLTRSDSNE